MQKRTEREWYGTQHRTAWYSSRKYHSFARASSCISVRAGKGRKRGRDAFLSRMNILSVLALRGWGMERVCVCVCSWVRACARACRAGVCMPLLSFLVCSDLFSAQLMPSAKVKETERDWRCGCPAPSVCPWSRNSLGLNVLTFMNLFSPACHLVFFSFPFPLSLSLSLSLSHLSLIHI